MLSVDWLELLSESDGVFLGLYVLSFASSPESDSVLKLSVYFVYLDQKTNLSSALLDFLPWLALSPSLVVPCFSCKHHL